LFRADQAVLELVVDQRVILGELRDSAVAREVDPRVADLTDDADRSGHVERRGGGAHAALLGVELAERVDHVGRVLDRAAHQLAELADDLGAAALLAELGELLLLALEPLPDEVDGLAAGDLAAGAAADAVADDEQPELGIGEECILVVGPLHAHVGVTEVADAHRCDSTTASTNSPTRSPGLVGRTPALRRGTPPTDR